MQNKKNLFFLLALLGLVTILFTGGCGNREQKNPPAKKASDAWHQEQAQTQAEEKRQASLHPDLKLLQELRGLVGQMDTWNRLFMSDQAKLLASTNKDAMTNMLWIFLGKAKGESFQELAELFSTPQAFKKWVESPLSLPAGPFIEVDGIVSPETSDTQALKERVRLGRLAPSLTLLLLEQCAKQLEEDDNKKSNSKIKAGAAQLELELLAVKTKIQRINKLCEQLDAAKQVDGSPLKGLGGLVTPHVYRSDLLEPARKAEASKTTVSFTVPVARLRLSDAAQARLLDKK